jgi:hypothetical protein
MSVVEIIGDFGSGLGPSPKYAIARLGRTDHRNDLELDQVAPLRCPLLEQAHILGLHQLKAPPETLVYPTVDGFEPRWQHPTLLSRPLVNGGSALPEPLNNHVAHASPKIAVVGCARLDERLDYPTISRKRPSVRLQARRAHKLDPAAKARFQGMTEFSHLTGWGV